MDEEDRKQAPARIYGPDSETQQTLEATARLGAAIRELENRANRAMEELAKSKEKEERRFWQAVPHDLLNAQDHSYQKRWVRKLLLAAAVNTTERGLLLRILEQPNKPELRLVYADWLEENGRQEEADAERAMAHHLQSQTKVLRGE